MACSFSRERCSSRRSFSRSSSRSVISVSSCVRWALNECAIVCNRGTGTAGNVRPELPLPLPPPPPAELDNLPAAFTSQLAAITSSSVRRKHSFRMLLKWSTANTNSNQPVSYVPCRTRKGRVGGLADAIRTGTRSTRFMPPACPPPPPPIRVKLGTHLAGNGVRSFGFLVLETRKTNRLELNIDHYQLHT